MQKLKNKKRLTAAVIAFMLVFVMGAAFAISPGALQALGGIGIAHPNLHVIWIQSDPTPQTTPIASTSVAVHNRPGINWPAGTVTPGQPPITPTPGLNWNQRLYWAVGFIQAGTVRLEAMAENVGTLPAMVDRPMAPSIGGTAWFMNAMLPAGTPNPFSLVVTQPIIGPGTTGTPTAGNWPVRLEPGETVEVHFYLNWDGVVPGWTVIPPIGTFSWPAMPGDFGFDFFWTNVYPNFGHISEARGYGMAEMFTFSLPYTLAP